MSEPLLINDFHGGVNRTKAISPELVAPYTVAHSLNINYDTTIGYATVRPGTTTIIAAVAADRNPLGLAEFVTSTGTTNAIVAVFSGASNGTIYYLNTGDVAWKTSNITNLTNTAKNRFAVLGNRIFKVNGTDAFISSAGGQIWNTTNTTTIVPAVIIRAKARLLVGKVGNFRSRVYFSSIVDMNASPTLTWSTNNSTGDWIDINPDDGDFITAFAETSDTVLVFKQYAMYRLNVVSKTVDPDNIFNIGAVSQESVTKCQGVVYFFSGQGIWRTTGNFPQQISRLGVQDFLDAVPQTSWANVTAGNDGYNVYFAIGDVTLRINTNDQTTYNNIVLKFSTRDESWSIHSYAHEYRNYAQYTTSSGRTFIGSDTSGRVQTINVDTTDSGTPIYFELITHDQYFGNKAHTKSLSDKMIVFTNYGLDSGMQIKTNDGDFTDVIQTLNERVNVSRNLNVSGTKFAFRWWGNTSGASPVLEGIQIEKVEDEGIPTQTTP